MLAIAFFRGERYGANPLMKILMIGPACDGEDVGESWIAFQWANLLSQRHDVTLLTTVKRGHTPASQQLPSIQVVEWPEPFGIGRFERFNSLMQPGYLPFYIRARRWIRNQLAMGEQFDIAHQVVPVAMRYPSPLTGIGIPFVIGPVGGSLESPSAFLVEEGTIPWWQKLRSLDRWRLCHDPLLIRTYESASCVVGVAPYVADFLNPLSIRRLEIMSDVAVQDAQELVDRTERIGPVRLLHVGRIIRTKGLRDVIRALGALSDLDLVLDVVGDGDDRSACELLVTEMQLEGRVTFHGRIRREAVDMFYKRADIFVFPSYREPGGTVTLEAMAFGLPVVVCRRGGPGANVTDECGIRLEAQNPRQLATDCAAAIRTLAEDSRLRQRMGLAGRNHVLRTHLWQQRVDRMTALYDELVAQCGPGVGSDGAKAG